MVIYQNNEVFKQIYSFRTLIYNGKTMTLWKKTMILYRILWNFDLLYKKIVMEKKPYSLL